jgi:hypothetical protein
MAVVNGALCTAHRSKNKWGQIPILPIFQINGDLTPFICFIVPQGHEVEVGGGIRLSRLLSVPQLSLFITFAVLKRYYPLG